MDTSTTTYQVYVWRNGWTNNFEGGEVAHFDSRAEAEEVATALSKLWPSSQWAIGNNDDQPTNLSPIFMCERTGYKPCAICNGYGIATYEPEETMTEIEFDENRDGPERDHETMYACKECAQQFSLEDQEKFTAIQ